MNDPAVEAGVTRTTDRYMMQRLFRQLISSREKSEDPEKQGQSQLVSDHKRLEFVQSLFKIKPETFSNFPGIQSYCDYLKEEALPPLTGPKFASTWDLISFANPKEIAGCWDWTLAVLQVIQSEQSDISIHDMLRRLKQQGGNSERNCERDQDTATRTLQYLGHCAGQAWWCGPG